MATEQVVGVLQAGSPDRLLDGVQTVNGASQNVVREVHVLGDDTVQANRARILTAAPSSGDAGLVVRAVGLPAAAALADGTSNPTLSALQAFAMAWDGALWQRFTGRRLGDIWYSSALPSGTISSGTSASATVYLAYLWHPSSITALRAFLRKISVAWMGGVTTDDTNPATLQLVRITAENGTPGGTSQTIQQHDPGAASSGMTFRTAPTGAPTPGNVVWAQPISLNLIGSVDIFPPAGAEEEDGGWQMRKSTAEGYALRLLTSSQAPTTAAQFGVMTTWTETAR